MPKESILVCVTGQRNCRRLILAGQNVARQRGAELLVLHALGENAPLMGNPDEREALNYLYECSAIAGAEMMVRRSGDPVQTIADCARENSAIALVLGTPGVRGGSEKTIASRLAEMLPACHILEIGDQQDF
ncbi:MAG: universal stress protein [Eubacteriales bacterium]|nr:universal stress protein [Eubacteriales bacterium]MDD3880871.1 universal stress protein [Eubacteriales bacterium]MDD4511762.1 universal stress protein [Eubacteriales bacterium]